MKTDLFQSCGHCWVFQICWHVECSIFTASSFRVWNNSTGIPLPPLALFIGMLSKAHLTSHSRMFASWWVITPSLLSGSLRSFLYSSSMYSYLLKNVPVCCDPNNHIAALNMPANLENSAAATGLEKVSFHSNPKERQYQRMLKLHHSCTHLTS